MDSDDSVTIDFRTAEFLAVLNGQVSWGNKRRAAEAAAKLGEAMGKRKMLTSLDCFEISNEASPITKAVNAERNMIIRFLRSHPGTEHLIAGIESGEYRKVKK